MSSSTPSQAGRHSHSLRTGGKALQLYRAVCGPASRRVHALIAVAAALACFFLLFHLDLLARANLWRFGYGDAAEHYVSFLYFFNDGWRFPLFYTGDLGFPYGTNVIFTDSIPLAALGAKLLHPLLPRDFNLFGIWILLCYALLAHAFASLLYYFGARSPVAALAGSILAVSSAFFPRLEHESLCGHFLVVYALLAFAWLTDQPSRPHGTLLFRALLAAALLVHLYLFAMVVCLYACALATLVLRRDWSARQLLREMAISFSIVVTVVLFSGHLSSSIPFGGVEGFGYYSMNLLAPVVAGRGFEAFRYWPAAVAVFLLFGAGYLTWNRRNAWLRPAGLLALGLALFAAVAWLNHIYGQVDATGGQYEGHNYLGMGVLLLLFFPARLAAGGWGKAARIRFLVLAAGLALMTIFALSDQVYAGPRLVFSYRLPKVLAVAAGQFRSSGRFFWPAAYALVAWAICRTLRLRPRWLGAALVLAAMGLQIADLRLERSVLQEQIADAPARPALDVARWQPIIAAHNLVVLLPPTQCGGSRKLYDDIGRIAGVLDIPMQSVAAARTPRAELDYCDVIENEIRAGHLRPKALYISGQASTLDALTASPEKKFCSRLDGLTVCTLRLQDLKLAPM